MTIVSTICSQYGRIQAAFILYRYSSNHLSLRFLFVIYSGEISRIISKAKKSFCKTINPWKEEEENWKFVVPQSDWGCI